MKDRSKTLLFAAYHVCYPHEKAREKKEGKCPTGVRNQKEMPAFTVNPFSQLKFVTLRTNQS
jgi:hypothetical protein